ncbi:MAG: hypothetical protein ACK51V_01620, partial [bacterium]
KLNISKLMIVAIFCVFYGLQARAQTTPTERGFKSDSEMKAAYARGFFTAKDYELYTIHGFRNRDEFLKYRSSTMETKARIVSRNMAVKEGIDNYRRCSRIYYGVLRFLADQQNDSQFNEFQNAFAPVMELGAIQFANQGVSIEDFKADGLKNSPPFSTVIEVKRLTDGWDNCRQTLERYWSIVKFDEWKLTSR